MWHPSAKSLDSEVFLGDVAPETEVPYMRPVLILCLLLHAACVHPEGIGGTSALASIDVVDATGRTFTLWAQRDKALVVDFCAAWSDPCLLNARALHTVRTQTRETHVKVISILMDTMGKVAVQSYQNVLDFEHEVLLPGPALRAGRTALGPIHTIPRLVLFAPGGNILEDIAGNVVSASGILARLRKVLPPEAFVDFTAAE